MGHGNDIQKQIKTNNANMDKILKGFEPPVQPKPQQIIVPLNGQASKEVIAGLKPTADPYGSWMYDPKTKTHYKVVLDDKGNKVGYTPEPGVDNIDVNGKPHYKNKKLNVEN